MWESTFTLPNYTRPQGWALQEPGKKVHKTQDELEGHCQEILMKHYGGLSLEPADFEDCVEYVVKAVSEGYGLSYNKLKRLIGQWLSGEYSQTQTEYHNGFQNLSTG